MRQKLDNEKFLLQKYTQDILSFLYVTDDTSRRIGMSGAKSEGGKFSNTNILNIDSFDKMEMLTDSYMQLRNKLENEEIYFHYDNINPKDIPNVDQCAIRQCEEGYEYNNIPCDYYLVRLKQIPLKTLRGVASPKSPYCYLLLEAYVHPDATMTTFRNTICWSGGKMYVLSNVQWRGAGDSFGRSHAKWVFDQDINNNALAPFMFAYTNLTHWRVALGFRKRARICLNLSPETIKLMFNDREKVFEDKRRPPLQHLVREHRRSHPYKFEEYISVIEHMRGHMHFNWYGLSCEILAPEWVLNNLEYKKSLKEAQNFNRDGHVR